MSKNNKCPYCHHEIALMPEIKFPRNEKTSKMIYRCWTCKKQFLIIASIHYQIQKKNKGIKDVPNASREC